jgi:hypothetical protein
MSEAAATLVEFGPEQVTLGTDLFRVLTTGEVPRLVELLNASGEGGPQAADGHVAIKVNGGAVSPGAGTGSLLGVTSNGNTALHLVASRGHAELTAFVCDSAPSLVATRNKGLDTPLQSALRGEGREQGRGGLPPVQDAHRCRWTGRGGSAAGKKLPRRHCFARGRPSQPCWGSRSLDGRSPRAGVSDN